MAVQYADSVSESTSVLESTTDPENGQQLHPHPHGDLSPMSLKEDQYLEKVLSQIRSDSVYELRRLQHQHRPVSGFESKPALEELLERRRQAMPPAETPPAAPGGSSDIDRRVQHFLSISASSGGAAEQHMPPSVRLEIRGLIERQQVSEVLGSARAGEIERALHEGLERRRNRQLQRRRLLTRSQSSDQRELAADPVRVSQPLQQLRRQPENDQYPVPQRDQSAIIRQLQSSPALGSLPPAERERVVSEVDHLVQQHLVTSALSGEFRGVLELHIQNRADQVREGVTVDDIRHSLQRRSDYSALTSRALDPEVPSSAAMSEMQQELREMKSQILQLKQLMRTSFDLQLEIQRSIRQEVAASLSSVCPLPPPPMAPGATVVSRTAVVESGNCVICSEASITSVVYRCGHMCVCMHCGLELKAQGLKCPICRAPITDIIQAYSSMQ